MPLLQLENTFHPDALEFTERLWAKAGILEFLVAKNPKLKDYILPGIYTPFPEVTVGRVLDILVSQAREVEEMFYRSTHPDDAVAYIGWVDNLSPESEVRSILKLEREIKEMEKMLLNPEEKDQKLIAAREVYERAEKETKETYLFIIDTIESVWRDWGLSGIPAYAINSMVIKNLEAVIRFLEYKKQDAYDNKEDTPMTQEELQIYTRPEPRRWYQHTGDEDVQAFAAYFHWEWHGMRLDEALCKYIDGKSIEEIQWIISDLQERDIPQYYDDHVTKADIDNMLVSSYFTQEQIDEKKEELQRKKQENLGKKFLFKQPVLEKYIEHNNLRGLDQTWLYVQEKLWDEWSFWTMLEHPHIPGRFLFSWRENQSTWVWWRSAMPGYLQMKNWSVEHQEFWAARFPMEKLVGLYDEIKKTELLIDDISLQIEVASKGYDVYILQVRAFRKKQIVDWNRDDLCSLWGIANVFWVTPEEGIFVDTGEWDFFRAHGIAPICPLELQKLKFAVSDCTAPFDHELTEVAYYPEIAVFWKTIEDILLQEWNYRVISNGVWYKLERNY